jgi:hypothetical protein
MLSRTLDSDSVKAVTLFQVNVEELDLADLSPLRLGTQHLFPDLGRQRTCHRRWNPAYCGRILCLAISESMSK